MVSKIVSRGARESAQPTIAVCGAWPCSTRSWRMAAPVQLASGRPSTKRLLPSCRLRCGSQETRRVLQSSQGGSKRRASWGSIGSSAAVRTARACALRGKVREVADEGTSGRLHSANRDMAETSHLQHTKKLLITPPGLGIAWWTKVHGKPVGS